MSFAFKISGGFGHIWWVLTQIFHSGDFLVIDYSSTKTTSLSIKTDICWTFLIWILSEFCGLPCYCAPRVCIPNIIGGLAVGRRNNSKTKNQKPKTKNPQPSDFCCVKFLGLFFALELSIMLFSTKIDVICFQNIGRFRARLVNFDTDISQWRFFSHRLLID